MGKDKQANETKKDKAMFSYGEPLDQQKFDRRKLITLILGGVTLVSLIVLGTIFSNNRELFSLIFSFYCIYLWILPLLFISLRAYQFSKHNKKQQKIGRIFMVFGFYFLFLWASALTGLLVYLGGLRIDWLAAFIFWVSVCGFVPYLLLVLILKL